MKRLCLLAGVVVSITGCAEPLHLMERGPGASQYSFWPPPPGSALWLPPPTSSTVPERLGAAALQLDAALVGAGYADARWYPVGSDYQHGFAVTTRLERLNRDPSSTSQRWSARYPEPPTLRWLTFAQTPALPQPGEYRSFLIAFTDLPLPGGGAAPTWSEETLIDGPGAPPRREVTQGAAARRVTPRYRFSVFEYDYDWDGEQQRGRLRIAGNTQSEQAWPAELGRFPGP